MKWDLEISFLWVSPLRDAPLWELVDLIFRERARNSKRTILCRKEVPCWWWTLTSLCTAGLSRSHLTSAPAPPLCPHAASLTLPWTPCSLLPHGVHSLTSSLSTQLLLPLLPEPPTHSLPPPQSLPWGISPHSDSTSWNCPTPHHCSFTHSVSF